MKKVAIAMSGGVDSGVAAALMIRKGYRVVGFYMRLWQESRFRDGTKGQLGKKIDDGGEEAARETAKKLNFPFYLVDFREVFRTKVVDYFLRAYAQGLTPNPCVVCNRFIKFGELARHVRKLGYYYLATGHYARIGRNTNFHLLEGRDKQKDQSYFLYGLTREQLSWTLLPLGNYLKAEIIEMAQKWQLPVAERPESQEICFFPESDYRPFLKRQMSEKIVPGRVVDVRGKVIGAHYGLPLYTIGQRHGFEIRVKERENERVKRGIIPPYYVINKDAKKNRLVVGFGQEAERKEFWVKDINWVQSSTGQPVSQSAIECKVRIRHQGELLDCRLGVGDRKLRVVLTEGERGIAPGQAAVFYRRVKERESERVKKPASLTGGQESERVRGQEDKRVKREEYEVLGGGIIS